MLFCIIETHLDIVLFVRVGRGKVGENLAYGSRDWTHAITGWHSEVNLFTYGDEAMKEMPKFKEIGHYTAVL